MSKWPCERVKPPSVEHKVNDGCERGAKDVSEKTLVHR